MQIYFLGHSEMIKFTIFIQTINLVQCSLPWLAILLANFPKPHFLRGAHGGVKTTHSAYSPLLFSIYFNPPFPVVLHLKPLPWLILLSLPSYLSPACRLSSASLPSFLLFCPADCATQPTSRVGGIVGTLNLLMQPFVVIASELAVP